MSDSDSTLPFWMPPGNQDEVLLRNGRVLTDYDTLLTAEVVLGYDREDLSHWFIDLYVPCSGACGADPEDGECEPEGNGHRVGHQYIDHPDLLEMFASAAGIGLREGLDDGIEWLFPGHQESEKAIRPIGPDADGYVWG